MRHRLARVFVLSISTAAVLCATYGIGYWQGSPVNIVMQPPAECVQGVNDAQPLI